MTYVEALAEYDGPGPSVLLDSRPVFLESLAGQVREWCGGPRA
jgi:hypothetical protein